MAAEAHTPEADPVAGASLAAHGALTEGVHGLPNAAPLEALRRKGTDDGWEGFDPATQTELAAAIATVEAALATKQDSGAAATDAELAAAVAALTAAIAAKQDAAGAATDVELAALDAELDAAVADLNAAVAAKQDASSAATDAELAAAVATLNSGLALKQDAATAATDAELAAAVATIEAALALKQDASAAATDAELAAAVATLNAALATKQDAATAATDVELSAHTDDAALDGGPHGLPALTADGMAWARQGGALVAVGVATQAELDVAVALRQPLDSDLTALAALSTTAFGRSLLEAVNAAALRGLADAQQADAELLAIAGLVSAADKMPYFTGSGTASLATVTTFIRSLLDDGDAATALATLGAASSAALAALDTRVGSVESGGVTVPACRAYHNANQSVATATITAVALNSERWDTHSFHSTSTNNSRLTVPADKGGLYQIAGGITYNNTDLDGDRSVFLMLNGSTIIMSQRFPAAIAPTTASGGTAYRLSAGDYIELVAYQDSGSSIDVLAIGNFTPELSLARIGL